MARFELEEGERILRREPVSSVDGNGKSTPKLLILTDRRIVLASDGSSAPLTGALFGGALGGLLGGLWSAAKGDTLVAQIERADFAEVEVTGKKSLKVRSRGEGYAMSWFEVTLKKPDEWVERIGAWAAEEA